jgi:hypothetical protein
MLMNVVSYHMSMAFLANATGDRMNIIYAFLAVIWLLVCWLVAKCIAWLFKKDQLHTGLIMFDLVMWSIAYQLVTMIERALSFSDYWTDLMLVVLWVLIFFGVSKRWKRHDQFKA